MARAVAVVIVVVLAAPPNARAQTEAAEASADAAAAPVSVVSAAAASATGDDAELAREEANIARLQSTYDLARNIVGGQHVVVAPVVFGGRRCATGTNVFNCLTLESRGGIAGIVIVPIVGAGGGHGLELWPHVQTDDVADGFQQFDKQFRRMRDVLAKPLGLPDANQASDAVLLQRFNTLAQAFDSALARMTDKESHSYYYDDMNRMRGCLRLLTSAPVLPRDSDPSSLPSPSPSTTPTSPKPPLPADACSNGIAQTGILHGWTMPQKLKYLNGLWQEYDLLVDAEPLSRHNLLIGPLAGFSITDKFGDVLYGGGLEAGWREYFRFTAAAGLRSSMAGSHAYLANMDRVGWWIGVGLSGQLGDELIDGILGVNRLFASATPGTN